MYTAYEKQLGKNIKKLRKECGFSQAKLAQKLQLLGCDIAPYTVSRIELAQKRVCAYELKCLKEVLGVSFDDILNV